MWHRPLSKSWLMRRCAYSRWRRRRLKRRRRTRAAAMATAIMSWSSRTMVGGVVAAAAVTGPRGRRDGDGNGRATRR